MKYFFIKGKNSQSMLKLNYTINRNCFTCNKVEEILNMHTKLQKLSLDTMQREVNKNRCCFTLLTSKKVSSLTVFRLMEKFEEGACGNQTSQWLDKSISSRSVTSSLPCSPDRR